MNENGFVYQHEIYAFLLAWSEDYLKFILMSSALSKQSIKTIFITIDKINQKLFNFFVVVNFIIIFDHNLPLSQKVECLQWMIPKTHNESCNDNPMFFEKYRYRHI